MKACKERHVRKILFLCRTLLQNRTLLFIGDSLSNNHFSDVFCDWEHALRAVAERCVVEILQVQRQAAADPLGADEGRIDAEEAGPRGQADEVAFGHGDTDADRSSPCAEQPVTRAGGDGSAPDPGPACGQRPCPTRAAGSPWRAWKQG